MSDEATRQAPPGDSAEAAPAHAPEPPPPTGVSFPEGVRLFGRRIAKGVLLLVWSAALLVLAVVAWSQQGDDILAYTLEHMRRLVVPGPAEVEDPLPEDLLRQFKYEYTGDAPPIRFALNEIDPDWSQREYWLEWLRRSSEVEVAGSLEAEAPDEQYLKRSLRAKYVALFDQAAAQMEALVDDPSLEVGQETTIPTDVIPRFFRDEAAKPAGILLSNHAVAWIESRRRIEGAGARGDLVNTFVLLITLGAFGSMVFLTRDYLTEAEERKALIASYVFRPLLGMLLAVGMFVVDLLAHAVVSSAEISALRREPLFILAFAAGLLSEQAYEAVSLRARDALQRFREGGDGGEPGAGAETENATDLR